MASVFPAPVSALQVGSYFVQQYYQVLQTQPDFVHQFYTDASNMTRIDGDSSESATAMMQIHTLIMSLNFTGIEIKTAHSLDSWNGGVLVMVTGSVVTKDYGRRKFIQTFFLAPQEKGYFVLNDIFQFVEEEQTHQHQAAILSQTPYDSAVNLSNPLLEPEPVPEYVPAVETQTREFVASPHVEESEPVEYSVPEQQYQYQVPEVINSVEEPHVEEYSLPESTTSFSHAVNPVQEASPVPIEEPVGEPQKHTYASILRVAKGPATSTLPPPQRYVAPKIEPPTSEWNHTPEPPQQFYSATAYGSDRSTAEPTEELATHEEGEGRSVYVKNLSTTVTALDIEEEFKNFGIIKPDGVVVRNRKDVGGVCYAFVEFEDVDGAQNAIKASPVQINGRQVYIEERRPNPNGYSVSRGRGRGRGRGGYSTESTRGGRYGGRGYGGRGSSGEGYDNREYNNNSRPSRGNGYVRRGPSQERGILGNDA